MRDWQSILLINVAAVLLLISSCQTSQTSSATTPDQTRSSMSLTLTPTLSMPSTTPLPVVGTTDLSSSSETRTGNADVQFVRAAESTDGTWTFHVTVEHPDTGWDDYADGWEVVTPDGSVLKPDPEAPFTRLLLHPHENEQPFTRSQSGILIPEGITEIRVRAHDLVDGFGGREVLVDMTTADGPDYIVERAE